MTQIELGERFERYIREAVESGRYPDATAVIEAALALMDAQQRSDAEKLEALRADLDLGLADVEAGRTRTFDRERLLAQARSAVKR